MSGMERIQSEQVTGRKRFDWGIFFIVLCAILIVAMATALGYLIRDRSDAAHLDADALAEAADTIEKYYYFYEDEQEKGLTDNALRGMVAGLGDPYAQYMTAEEYDAMLADDAGDYKGLGISVAEPDENGSVISEVYDGSPAAQAGLIAGDLILTVNGTDVRGMQFDEMLDLFSVDDAVADVLTIVRGEETMEFTVLRGEVHVNRVYSEVLDDGIGYLRITQFYGTVADEFWTAAEAFRAQGIHRLVIDIRDNPGGGLTEVLGVCDHVVPDGAVITTIKSKTESEEVYRAKGTKRIDMDVIVLVNGNSASASELFAGAMQSHQLATIVGTQTYGKGIVQSYFRLRANGGWVKITTDAYYTPSDECIQGVGITPDVIVELPEELRNTPVEMLDRPQDTQLQAALDLLQE